VEDAPTNWTFVPAPRFAGSAVDAFPTLCGSRFPIIIKGGEITSTRAFHHPQASAQGQARVSTKRGKNPMSNAGVTGPAVRVATTIGVFKWILVCLTLLAGVITAIAMLSDNSSDYSTTIGVGAVLGAILYALMTWVLFGWFEHTLRALAQIATNTAVPASSYQQAPQYQQPFGG
jgi:small-conductance mechanosensitive channel